MRKYLWLDGTTHNEPDPDWTQEKAKERGIIPTPSSAFDYHRNRTNLSVSDEVLLANAEMVNWTRSNGPTD